MLLRRLGQVLILVFACVLAVPAATAFASTVGPPCGTNGVAANPAPATYTCTYTTAGSDTFNVPATVHTIIADAIGGTGGPGYYRSQHPELGSGGGGKPAEIGGQAEVTASSTLTVYVAGNGGTGTLAAGGAGGLGHGGPGGNGGSTYGGGGGGGGASSVKGIVNGVPDTPLFIAAGGGGGGSNAGSDGANGGAAGQDGQDGYNYECAGGTAGTTSAGGDGGGTVDNPSGTPVGEDKGPCVSVSVAENGGPEQGGTGGNGSVTGGGGGGGGRYGGGGGQGSDDSVNPADSAGGGGGSSFSVDPDSAPPTTSAASAKVVIRYSLPDPNFGLIVREQGGAAWDDTETVGSKAHGDASFIGSPSPHPSGTVTYRFYENGGCSGASHTPEVRTVNAGDGSVPSSADTSLTAAGSYSMRAVYSGDNNYDVVASTCASFTVVKKSQSISFSSNAPAVAVVGGTYHFGATATSGLTVHFRIDAASDDGVCSLTAGTLSFKAVGSCVLDATQPGNTTFNQATQRQQTITIRPQSGGAIAGSIGYAPAAGKHQTIRFTYTAPPGGTANGTVRLTVPDGWSAPSATGSAAGFSIASTGTRTISGRTIVVNGVTLPAGGTLVITYGARSGGGPGAIVTTSYGAKRWAAKQRSTTVGNPAALPSRPSITVVASDGSGLATANVTSVPRGGAHQTIRVTYTLWPGGMHGGKLTLTVPDGWNLPSRNATAAGYVTVDGGGSISISNRTITVSGITQAAGTTLAVTYGSRTGGGPGATAPSTKGVQTWTVRQQSTSTSSLIVLDVSPMIKVKSPHD